jgi:hypothetical protein
MSKTSTIQFTINDLSSKSNEELSDINSCFDYENEFKDVFEVLNKLDCDVRQDVVDSIIKYSLSKE